jgi:16S rRNA (adenine1518-N6/adenine1519-N6)-dimethyltransferase
LNPDSPADIRALLAARNLSLKKRWGQNFLVNRGVRERLVSLLSPTAADAVWEIGPGLGSMTELLLGKAGKLVAFEVDRGLCRYLEETFSSRAAFTLVPGDYLETWRAARDSHGSPDLLLGNLPYRSASIMLADAIEGELRPRRIVATVQRELAERMGAVPGTKSYSSFSVLCQSCFKVTGRGDIQAGSFYPAPEVVSSVIEMNPLADAPSGSVLQMMSMVARGLFASRRKTIRNNMVGGTLAERIDPLKGARAMEEAGIDPSRRAEELPPEAFVRLARLLEEGQGPDARPPIPPSGS